MRRSTYRQPAFAVPRFTLAAFQLPGLTSRTLAPLPHPTSPPHTPTTAASWKSGMGLRKQGKEGSISLACHLLPAAAPVLT